MSPLWRRAAAILHRRRRNADLDAELAAHLSMDIQERIEAGEEPRAARDAARRDLGEVTRITEDTRAAWGWTRVEQFVQDLRHAIRSARRNPGFTSAAVLTLALAIGATTAIFSFVYAALLRPLPFRQPDRIIRVFESRRAPTSAPNFLDWQARNRIFDTMAAFRPAPRTIVTRDGVDEVGGMQASAAFFGVLGVQPVYGRDFLPEDDRAGAERVAIVSHDFWRARLNGRRSAVGSALILNDERVIVIGVLPRGFRFSTKDVSIWTPLRLEEHPQRMNRTERYLHVVARLRDGVTLPQADAATGGEVALLQEDLVGNLRESFFVILAASGLLLLIGCANLTNLLLARSLARERELTIRVALGARRLRIFRQLITESVVIGLLGGAAGTLVAIWGVRATLPLLTRLGGAYGFIVSRMAEPGVDRVSVLLGIGLALAAAVFCAIVSAAHATRVNVGARLQHGRNSRAGPRRTRARGALVVGEITLTFVLLVAAGLLLNSFWRLRRVDLGFDPRDVITMRLHSSPPEAIDFYQSVVERVRELPGITSASVVSSLPVLGIDTATAFVTEHRPQAPGVVRPQAAYKVVGHSYFEAMRIPLLQGRYFDRRDGETGEPVAIVNQAFAREHWPHEGPIGRRIQRGGPKRPWITVVGVVKDVKVSGPDTATPSELYLPHAQVLFAPRSRLALPNMTLVVRTASGVTQSVAAVRGAVRTLDPDMLITDVGLMEAAIGRIIAPRELNTVVVVTFGGVALCLVVIGVYGVLSYTVANRTREIGVRVALGAQPREILFLVLRHGLLIVSVGVILGLAGALATTRWMSGLLFDVGSSDPATLSAIILVVLGVSLTACWVPARRAVALDPVTALRNE